MTSNSCSASIFLYYIASNYTRQCFYPPFENRPVIFDQSNSVFTLEPRMMLSRFRFLHSAEYSR